MLKSRFAPGSSGVGSEVDHLHAVRGGKLCLPAVASHEGLDGRLQSGGNVKDIQTSSAEPRSLTRAQPFCASKAPAASRGDQAPVEPRSA